MNDINKSCKTYEEVFYDYTVKEIKKIVGNKVHISPKFPVIIAYHYPNKKKAYEQTLQVFKSLDEIKNFINSNRGIVIFKMFKNRDETRYGVRFFNGLKFCSRWEFWYSNIRVKIRKMYLNAKGIH